MLNTQIFTGQLSQIDYYIKNGLNVVSIARKKPVWFNGPEILELAPSIELLQRYHSGLSFGVFSKEFNEYLETLDLVSLQKKLEALGNGHSGVILCCYEKSGKFCHRHLVSWFLGKSFDQTVREFS